MEPHSTLDDVIWSAFTYADELLAIAHELQEAIDACKENGGSNGSEVTSIARRAFLLMESKRESIVSLIEATGGEPEDPFDPDAMVYHGDEDFQQSRLERSIGSLKKGVDATEEWVKSILVASRMHRRRLHVWLPSHRSLDNFCWLLDSALENIAAIQPIRQRLMDEATTLDGGFSQPNPDRPNLQAPEGQVNVDRGKRDSDPTSDLSNEPSKDAAMQDTESRSTSNEQSEHSTDGGNTEVEPPDVLNGKLTVDRRFLLLLRNAEEAANWKSTQVAEAINSTPEAVRQCRTWKNLQSQKRGARNGYRAGNPRVNP